MAQICLHESTSIASTIGSMPMSDMGRKRHLLDQTEPIKLVQALTRKSFSPVQAQETAHWAVG